MADLTRSDKATAVFKALNPSGHCVFCKSGIRFKALSVTHYDGSERWTCAPCLKKSGLYDLWSDSMTKSNFQRYVNGQE